MSYRFMRLIVFFDLPSVTKAELREYRKFKKMLIKNGFFMLQESVYTRMVLNSNISKQVVEVLKNNKPKDGIVQVMTITEKQFANSEIITGEYNNNTIDSTDRIIVL